VKHYTAVATDGSPAVVAWDKVWIVPSLFAAGVMVVFFLLFHDKIRPSERDAADAPLQAADTETAV
jgi:hypothetical protein